ncbi:hypothetical protein BZA70DRAFT_141301 [Myxozyma melibiosi]|uniref:Uncharacterized protein n=1 Tax=Myxozyma melibiosi TaxID=54550 RepID=A0ABR1F7E3_9ASCO
MWSSSVYVWLLWRILSAPIVIPLRLVMRIIRGVFWPIPVLARFMWSVVRAMSFARVILASLDPLYFFFFTGISIGIAVGIVLGVSSAAAQFVLQINGASLRRKEANKTRVSVSVRGRGFEDGVEREAGREESREASRRKEIDYDGFREWYDEERAKRLAARNAENEARINKAEKEKEEEEEVYQRTRYELKYDRGWMTPPSTILEEEEEEEVYASGSENRRQEGQRSEEETMERGRRRSYGKKRQGLQMR